LDASPCSFEFYQLFIETHKIESNENLLVDFFFKNPMCYFPALGVICTADGVVYSCSADTRVQLIFKWTNFPYTDVKSILFYENGVQKLRLHYSDFSWQTITTPQLQPVLQQLKYIQKAVRDWLHGRRVPLRMEIALYLDSILPCDLSNLIIVDT